MARNSILTWLLAAAFLSLAAASHGDEIPGSWKRTMTNDPSTNYFLAKITKPLGSKDAELLRTVIVSLVAIKFCKGVSVNDAVAKPFLKANGYYEIRGKAWSDAQFLAKDGLHSFTHRELAHLCVGLNYLFGPSGAMASNLVTFKATEPKYPYNPANPYPKIPELPQPKS